MSVLLKVYIKVFGNRGVPINSASSGENIYFLSCFCCVQGRIREDIVVSCRWSIVSFLPVHSSIASAFLHLPPFCSIMAYSISITFCTTFSPLTSSSLERAWHDIFIMFLCMEEQKTVIRVHADTTTAADGGHPQKCTYNNLFYYNYIHISE